MNIKFIGLRIALTGAIILVQPACKRAELLIIDRESIGGLKIGMLAHQVRGLIPAVPVLGPIELWKDDGLFHQSWKFQAQGLELWMESALKDGPQKLEFIIAEEPCEYQTSRGIHIGSPEVVARAAYRTSLDTKQSTLGKFLIVDNEAIGLVIIIENGAVSRISLGFAGIANPPSPLR